LQLESFRALYEKYGIFKACIIHLSELVRTYSFEWSFVVSHINVRDCYDTHTPIVLLVLLADLLSRCRNRVEETFVIKVSSSWKSHV
jgi:hypothetical protein